LGRYNWTPLLFAGFSLAVLCSLGPNLNAAGHLRHRQSRATPSPFPTTNLALRPLVLIAGGTGTVAAPIGESPAVLNSAEVYDCVKGVFLPINSMTTARDRDASTALPNGKVLFAGGIDTSFAVSIPFTGAAVPWILSSTEVFDPLSGAFAIGPKMAVSRDQPTATLLRNSEILIVGGGASSGELFDLSSNKLVATGAMAESRYGQSATLLGDGKVLIAGGGAKMMEVYDPRTSKFTPSAKLRSDRIYHTATILRDGTVLIAGGSPYARSAAMDTTEIYDESHRSEKAGPKMKEARAGHTATLLPGGHVLIAGGHNDNSAELYDGHQFVRASHMNESRYGHSATLLPDGKVLIAGGWGSNYKPLASAEIYDPTNGRFLATSNMTQPRAGHTATLIWVDESVDWIKPTATPTTTPTPDTN
jgi:hypothetical protein